MAVVLLSSNVMTINCVLGIETSCDETAVAVYHAERGILAHCLHSQVAMHAKYGGVVPELASRDHIRHLVPLVRQTMTEANVTPGDLEGIAYTKGPGLAGALLVGACLARTLAWTWQIPSIGVHHLEAHLLAAMLEGEQPEYPFIALLVSGGHTLLIEVSEFGCYRLLGETLDDAVGEAFDKTAKLMGLPYPGGAPLEQLAMQGKPGKYTFPRPMTDRPGLDFSFSGLKTHALNTLERVNYDEATYPDIACAFQAAIIDTLVIKCRRALEKTHCRQLVVAGGVGANKTLRQAMQQMVQERGGKVFYPRPAYCTDNGAMVAYAGYQRLSRGFHDDLTIDVWPRWKL